MVFPGVLRGRPEPRLATTHTNRPCRSLSSPWMLLPLQSSLGRCERACGPGNESDADPGRSRNLPRSPPRGASSGSGGGPHTSLASLFAARFRVWIQLNQHPRAVQGPRARRSRNHREKACGRPRGRRRDLLRADGIVLRGAERDRQDGNWSALLERPRRTKETRSRATLRNHPQGQPEGRLPVPVARPHTSVASLFAARFRVCRELTPTLLRRASAHA